MATAESPPREDVPAPAGSGRRWVWIGLAVVLTGGLGLRLWGVRQGLPFAYNADEADHFVPHAVEMFREGTLNPHYFANPPAFTYLLHYLYALSYGGAGGVVHAYAAHPGDLYTLARIAAALLGTLAIWLLYLTGSRLFGRAAGLLAAAVESVAFLPVFYAHLALNDVPTLAPATLSLLGSAGVLRKGRLRDHVIAGIGLGLACATKYTAGIVVLPYVAAVIARLLDSRRQKPAAGPSEGAHTDPAQEPSEGARTVPGAPTARARTGRARTLVGVAILLLFALAAFLIANPYSLLDYSSFHRELAHQSSLSAEAQGKLGAPKDGGLLYYLWSLTWGLGWVPALGALAGAIAVWFRDRRTAWILVPTPLLYLAFMGTQGRYFGRWLMPVLPILCLLAAFAAVQTFAVVARPAASGRTGRWWLGLEPGRRRPSRIPPSSYAALLVLALIAQGLVYSIHSGLVLSRADTRTLTREWMVANIPRGAKVVVEPVSPNQWAFEERGSPPGCPTTTGSRYRWCKWPSLYSFITPAGTIDRAGRHEVGIENYVRTLAPALIDYYERSGFCWIVTGSTEAGRAEADPGAVPLAIAYYRRLAAQGKVVYRSSPYSNGSEPVAFNFDWSFDYYPWAYRRPGPAMTVYRLDGGRCGR
jgi:Dolichyl-phosphate-mannose-protein mannosyltransferase